MFVCIIYVVKNIALLIYSASWWLQFHQICLSTAFPRHHVSKIILCTLSWCTFSSFHRLHSVFVISRWIVSVNLAFVRLILLWYPHLMIILHKFVECRNCVRPLTLRALWTPLESRYSRPRCATVSSWFSSCQAFHTHLSIVWGAAFDEGHLNDNLYHCDKPSSKKHYKDCFVCIINHENTPIQIVFCVKRSNTHFNVSELKNENGDFVL